MEKEHGLDILASLIASRRRRSAALPLPSLKRFFESAEGRAIVNEILGDLTEAEIANWPRKRGRSAQTFNIREVFEQPADR
jgi:hypothetical protein